MSIRYERKPPTHTKPRLGPGRDKETIDTNLKEWDPKSLPDNFFVVLEGKRRTGKSTFAKWLLQWYKDRFALAWVMTKTKMNGFWQEMVGESFTFDNFYPSAISRLLERNDAIVRKYGPKSPQAKEQGSTLLILDDVISGNVLYDPTFKLLAVEGRHHLLSVILATQDPKAISPLVRDNADLAIVFNQKTYRNKESIWMDFMNDIPKDPALELLAQHAVDHNGLVCIQTNLDGEVKKNFMKTTGDKTKLWAGEYLIGSEEQKRIAREEKREREARLRRAQGIKTGGPGMSEVRSLTASRLVE